MSEPPPGGGPYVLRPPGPTGEIPPPRRKLVDRTIGIALGIVIGLVVIAAFVFLGSESTVDAPSLSGGRAARQAPASPPTLPGEGR